MPILPPGTTDRFGVNTSTLTDGGPSQDAQNNSVVGPFPSSTNPFPVGGSSSAPAQIAPSTIVPQVAPSASLPSQVLVFPQDIKSQANYPYTMFTIKRYDEPNIIRDVVQGSARINANIVDTSTTDSNKNQTDTRSTQTIVLPLPQELSNAYKPEWEMGDKIFINDITRAVQTTGATLSSVATGLKHFTASLLLGPVTKAAQLAITNPKQQALFTGIGPRTFTFNYVMIAQNLQEANTVEQIYKTFDRYSLPKVSNSDADFFLFPFQYEIRFFNVQGLPIIKAAVCNGVSTNFGIETIQILKSGHPTEIGLSLDFVEVDLRTFDDPGF